MIGSHEFRRNRPAMNPFCVPRWENFPLRPLCPWRENGHEDYYVPVDDTHEAFEEFKRRMSNLGGLREDGRLVFVTGESGCGKTALINRCASWVRNTLPAHELTGVIIDLTTECPPRSRRSIDERIGHVCSRLVDDLIQERLLSVAALRYLAEDRGRPDRVYPYLGGALEPKVVLIVLLPPSEDLVEEVIRYAGLARKRLLLFAESSYLDQAQTRRVRHSHPTRPPIVLKVGELRPGDVRRYVTDRLERHAKNGIYPRISEETMKSLTAGLRSVAMLQRILSDVYENRLQQKLRYSESDSVTYEDITSFFFEEEFLKHPGMWNR